MHYEKYPVSGAVPGGDNEIQDCDTSSQKVPSGHGIPLHTPERKKGEVFTGGGEGDKEPWEEDECSSFSSCWERS